MCWKVSVCSSRSPLHPCLPALHSRKLTYMKSPREPLFCSFFLDLTNGQHQWEIRSLLFWFPAVAQCLLLATVLDNGGEAEVSRWRGGEGSPYSPSVFRFVDYFFPLNPHLHERSNSPPGVSSSLMVSLLLLLSAFVNCSFIKVSSN